MIDDKNEYKPIKTLMIMRRTLLAIVATLLMTTTMNAQRLTDITAEARFITDKMAVELGLTNVQRASILNLNITYLDGINSYRDINARGWTYRNKQIRALLNAAQWKKFKDCTYFYRPIGWRDNAYVHNIYNKYPCHGRPTPPPGVDKRIGKASRSDCDFGKPGKKDGSFKDYRHAKDKDYANLGKGVREFDNNSPEAIKMRKDMRKGNRWAR